MLHLRPFVFLLWIAGLCSLPVFLLECFFFCLLIWEPFLNQRFCLFVFASFCSLSSLPDFYFIFLYSKSWNFICVCVCVCSFLLLSLKSLPRFKMKNILIFSYSSLNFFFCEAGSQLKFFQRFTQFPQNNWLIFFPSPLTRNASYLLH